MKIRNTKTKIVCDYCLQDNIQKKATKQCLFCAKHFCSQHGFDLIKYKKVKKYRYEKELKAYICDYCADRINI